LIFFFLGEGAEALVASNEPMVEVIHT